MNIIDCFDDCAGYIMNKFSKKIEYVELLPQIKQVFTDNDEGIYIINIRSDNGLLGKIIGYFSDGFYHTVPVIYSEKFFSMLTLDQQQMIAEKFNESYKNINDKTFDNVNIIVLGSAEMKGMRFYDLSKYNKKNIVINKIELNSKQMSDIIQYIFKIKNVSYDFLGVLFFKLYKKYPKFRFFDSEKSKFCSELVYDAFMEVGVKVSSNDNPGPGDIYNYLKDDIIYDSNKNK